MTIFKDFDRVPNWILIKCINHDASLSHYVKSILRRIQTKLQEIRLNFSKNLIIKTLISPRWRFSNVVGKYLKNRKRPGAWIPVLKIANITMMILLTHVGDGLCCWQLKQLTTSRRPIFSLLVKFWDKLSHNYCVTNI